MSAKRLFATGVNEGDSRTTDSRLPSGLIPKRSRNGCKRATTARLRIELTTVAVVAALLTACSDSPAPEPSPRPTQTTPDGDRAVAERAARTTLETWARPTLPYGRWWKDLKPLLTPEAAEDYAETDPANIPALRITGRAVERAEPYDPNVTTFYFETTEGTFGVDVARSPGGPWRAFSIVFPGTTSMRQ